MKRDYSKESHWYSMWKVTNESGSSIDIGNKLHAQDAIDYANAHCRDANFTSAELIYDPTGICNAILKRYSK